MKLPIIDGEIKGPVRWGRQFFGILLRNQGDESCVILGSNIVWVKHKDLLWFALRPDGQTDFIWPKAWPQTDGSGGTEDLSFTSINGAPR